MSKKKIKKLKSFQYGLLLSLFTGGSLLVLAEVAGCDDDEEAFDGAALVDVAPILL